MLWTWDKRGSFFSCASRGSNPRPGGFRFRTPTSRACARSLEAAKSARHNQISSSDQDTQDQDWQAIPEVTMCPNFWSMRSLSCSCFWSSSNRLAFLCNTSSAAAVFFFSSSRWSWRIVELYFWALSSRRSAASRAREDFEEGVDRPAFFKNVLLELFCDKTLETTSALGNGACLSATTCARIVSIDNYKMKKWTI